MTKTIKSFGYAISGIATAFRLNLNLKIHFVIAILAVILGVVFNLNHLEFILLTILIVLVFAAEMINSAIEEVVDLLTKEHSIEAKIAKDVSAGMVLIVAVGALICGIIIFIPHIFK